MAVVREYKDRLFKFIFGSAQNKEWTLSLYNAVNGSAYTDVECIRFTTIEDALFISMKNDVSFLISGPLNLYEQQSSYNPDMPLRYLMYAGMSYAKYIESSSILLYSSYLQRIPAPRCLCFYDGTMDTEDRVELKLSSLCEKESDIEVKVTMININYGRNRELLECCKPLEEYSWFVAEIRKNQKKMEFKDAVTMALEAMPDGYVIKPFLIANKAEVEIMCLTEYDEVKYTELVREEGRAEGKAEGVIETLVSLLKKGLINESNAAQSAGMSIEDFRKAKARYCN